MVLHGCRLGVMCWVLCSGLVHSAATGAWYKDSQDIMGTRVAVELYTSDARAAQSLLQDVMDEMHRIDRAFSPYKPNSELSVLNAHAGTRWVSVSAELLSLLQQSRRMSELTQGAFDVTYASVGRYYDYRKRQVPDDDVAAAALHAIDYQHVEIDVASNRVRFNHPQVYVDLGGIAKGYAVDRCIAILQQADITQASVSAGGDSVILGDRGGQPWTVGIKHPRQPDKMSAVLPLEDTAVSTSGDYERYFEAGGVRYHHILDPSTGKSATGAWSVTILGPNATFTDALSTSVFVLGPEKGLALVDTLPGIDAIIIDPNGKLQFSAELAELAP